MSPPPSLPLPARTHTVLLYSFFVVSLQAFCYKKKTLFTLLIPSDGSDIVVLLDAVRVPLPVGTPRVEWGPNPAPAPLYVPGAVAEPASPTTIPAVLPAADGSPPSQGRGRPTEPHTCSGEGCGQTPLIVSDRQQAGWQYAIDPGRPGQCQLAHIPAAGGVIPDPTTAPMWNTYQTSTRLRERGPLGATADELRHVCYRWVARAVYGSTGWHNRFELPQCWVLHIAHLYPNENHIPYSWEPTSE